MPPRRSLAHWRHNPSGFHVPCAICQALQDFVESLDRASLNPTSHGISQGRLSAFWDTHQLGCAYPSDRPRSLFGASAAPSSTRTDKIAVHSFRAPTLSLNRAPTLSRILSMADPLGDNSRPSSPTAAQLWHVARQATTALHFVSGVSARQAAKRAEAEAWELECRLAELGEPRLEHQPARLCADESGADGATSFHQRQESLAGFERHRNGSAVTRYGLQALITDEAINALHEPQDRSQRGGPLTQPLSHQFND